VRLTKFYLDMVTPEGAGAIGYAMRASWGGLTLQPSALLSWSADAAEPPVQTQTWRGAFPVHGEGRIDWHDARLATSGQWVDAGSPWREQCLWEDERGRVVWQTLAPAATVAWQHGGSTFQGRGYAEVLRIEGALWRLPIRTLRWGRFVSATRNVTWIAWECAGETRSWLWHGDDVPERTVSIDTKAVAWGAHRLELQPCRTLRDGMTGKTVVAPLRGKRWFPRWTHELHETKWLARGQLSGPDQLQDEGWVIHEVVHFPNR